MRGGGTLPLYAPACILQLMRLPAPASRCHTASRWTALVLWSLAVMVPCFGQQPQAAENASSDFLKTFLQKNYSDVPPSDYDKTTRYFAAFVDLNGDGKPEAVVYLSGRLWCGSGGCHTLILERRAS